MSRNRPTTRKRISADAAELGRLSLRLSESGGKLEDAFWEKKLSALVNRLLQSGAEDDLNASLDRLLDSNAPAHDCLADIIESCTESCAVTHKGQNFDILLINIPLLAWSRFSIPSGSIPKTVMETLKTQLGAHVLSADARLSLADYLYSPDQLPHSFVDIWRLTHELGCTAIDNTTVRIDPSTLPETNPFLSDTRYLIGAIAVPSGKPLFRWNEADNCTREAAHREWIKQGGPCFEPLLTGCAFQPLLADAYHAACRSADMASRPYSLRASVAFLQTTLGKPAESLRVVIGGFHDKQLEEYRVGFGPRDNDAIFHGIVWPLLGSEDENSDIPGEIENLLRESGIKDVVIHEQHFPLEFCEDCGAPLYPNVDGEAVHAEMPEQGNAPSQTLH
ncbi:MAG: DUF2863 family protein [Candidatus Accumulibacter sp.]|jgi:hypothetical protein|nr:DUF2863 family protein [Accumulibacter sp.]